MIRRVLMGAAALTLVAGSTARAVEAPRAGQADARMRTVDYDPTQVVRVVGAFRTATQIVLSEGETVSHVALGDSSAWDVAADRNILFIKPKEAHGATNLIVTTSRGPETRSYTFELTTPDVRKGKRTAATYYQLRFRYPADERARVTAVISAEEAALRQKVTQFKLDRGVLEGRRNLAYTLQGSQALQPSEVSDNGRFTVLRFPAAQPIPSIYTLTPDGSETLVPFDVRGEFVVIHSVNRQLRLRRGREVLAIWNDGYSPYGVNPGTNTAATDVDRTDKGVQNRRRPAVSDVAADFDFEGPAPAPRRPWRDGEGEARPAFDHSGRARHGADAEDGPSALRAGGKPAQGEIPERTISPIAGRFGLGKGGKAVTVAALSVGCGVLYFASLSHGNTKHHAPKTAPQPVKESVDYASTRNGPPPATGPTLAQPGPNAPSLTGAPGPGAITPDPNMVDASGTAARAGAAGGPVTVGATRVSGSGPAEAARRAAGERLARLQAIRSAPLMAYGASRSAEAPEAGVQSGVALVSAHGDGAGATELDQLRRGSSIGMVKAQRLPDRNFLVVAGALLPCTLETAMDTSAPGYVTCRISRDVYSDNGSVVLMEKGSRVLGEYRSGQQQGRRRIFVLWNRIVTPDGVAVDVSSPASDALGRAGFDGVVDTHFWDRFGGALLMSAVGDGLSGVASANSRYGSVVQAPQEAAAVALQNSVNIPPTLRKAQGSEVAIFVSRDLDFSGVYALKAR